jgi:hypothetical protein
MLHKHTPLVISVRVEANGEWMGRNVACRIVKMRTTVPNTTVQTFDAVKREWEAHPSSEAEMEKRLSTKPATKRRIEMIKSCGRKSMVGDRYFSALCQRWYISVTRLQASRVFARVREVT